MIYNIFSILSLTAGFNLSSARLYNQLIKSLQRGSLVSKPACAVACRNTCDLFELGEILKDLTVVKTWRVDTTSYVPFLVRFCAGIKTGVRLTILPSLYKMKQSPRVNGPDCKM